MSEITVVPATTGETTFCLAFYDWEKQVEAGGLEVIESLFGEFGVAPSEGTGNVKGGKSSHGRYSRVRRRLASYLNEDGLNIRVSGPVSVEHDVFFPCDMRIVLSTGARGWKQGMIAVRGRLADSLERFVERVQLPVFGLTGAAYATGFEFPASFGPDAYLSSVSTVPHRDVVVPKAYKERITCWRDRARRKGIRPSDGFLREVYPINFLSSRHLERACGSGTLRELVGTVGDLAEVPLAPGTRRWDVPESELHAVRHALESSGLVLSAPGVEPASR